MRISTLCKSVCLALAGYSAVSIPTQNVYAQAHTEEDTVEKIAVVGARGAPRSVASSPVPVDVLSADDITSTAFSDMNDVISTLVPSYTLNRQPIADGATFIRPAQLRGLPTDKTLVLVNSKRRHRASLVQIGGSGAQGPDLATIPIVAIGTVEVLRDGAAAQYGSDAIAGVMNFQLKENTEGGIFTAEVGQFYEGDGEQFTIAGNKGFALGDDGFLSLSAEYVDSEATFRGEQYCESWFCVDDQSEQFIADALAMSRSVHGSEVVQPWGQPNAKAARVFFNAGYNINDDMEVYGFGNFSDSEGDGSFFYRYPGNGTIEDLRLEDGSIWSPLEFFPGGFTPRFSGDVTDYSFVGGLKGMSGDLSWDISGRYGYNEISYTIENTINPSMGNMSPTLFKPGDLSNEEVQFQADFVYDFDDFTLAWGASYMDETYEIEEGDVASYTAGPYASQDPWGFCDGDTPTAAGATVIANGSTLNCADSSDPVYRVVGVGSNGFPGFSPAFSEDYNRDSYALYTDISGDITDELFAQAALRYEDYSDFGSELVYKVAGFYQVTDDVGIRSSFGTGFRAPTPGQQGTTNVSTRLPNGFPVATGLFPAGGPIAQALGANPLAPEKSTNFTLGLTASYGDFNLTVDYYHIALEDRLNAVSTMDVSTTVVTDPDASGYQAYQNFLALSSAGVVGAESIGGVFFFQNAFDTITEGVDVVATYTLKSDYGVTTFTASGNYNTNEFDSDPSEFFNLEDQFDFENQDPNLRAVLSAKHSAEDFDVLLRLNYFGGYENSNGIERNDAGEAIGVSQIQEFDPEVMVDIEGTYHISETYSLTAGVRNLFDNYPDPGEIGETCCGRIYRSDSIVSWQGGYYYAKFIARF